MGMQPWRKGGWWRLYPLFIPVECSFKLHFLHTQNMGSEFGAPGFGPNLGLQFVDFTLGSPFWGPQSEFPKWGFPRRDLVFWTLFVYKKTDLSIFGPKLKEPGPGSAINGPGTLLGSFLPDYQPKRSSGRPFCGQNIF